ncbi:MAG: sugar phosphate nucleotidyltransferase [Nanoarchaeota archaeon]
MQIVIPMSGIGRRFIESGYSNPKPLIEVEGKPIIEHVINMFPGEDDFLFICNSDHLKNTKMREIIKKLKPSAKIISIKPHKFGPVYAVMKAKKFLHDDSPIIVNYCDFNAYWDYGNFKMMVEKTGADGCVPCYTGFHPHLLRGQLYAGVKADENNRVLEIKEKHRFTPSPFDTWHSSGTYYFSSGKMVKDYFSELLSFNDKKINGEHYVSTVYELMLRDKLKVYVYEHKYFCQWGTPQDLQEYQWWSELFKKITSGLIAEETIKFKISDGRRIFDYWKEFFSLSNFHSFGKGLL